ncbi:MAG: hypothetical protein RSE34_03235, partial [Brevundimonas sp.]
MKQAFRGCGARIGQRSAGIGERQRFAANGDRVAAMWRILLIVILLTALPTALRAQEAWEMCSGAPGEGEPVLSDCRPLDGAIDPQGRELWLRAVVQRPTGDDAVALYVVGAASSEAWLNGQKLGANGRPGDTKAAETPGRYEAALPIPERMWR